MILITPDQQAGAAGKAGSQFTGDVHPYLTNSADGVTINTVTFTPGARTYWHRHEHGQVLLVLSGRGLIQSAGGDVEQLLTGTTVWVPADERHWHGAAPGSAMTHVAISLGTTKWEEPVADGDYADPVGNGARA